MAPYIPIASSSSNRKSSFDTEDLNLTELGISDSKGRGEGREEDEDGEVEESLDEAESLLHQEGKKHHSNKIKQQTSPLLLWKWVSLLSLS